jgi:hypothetical protein
MLRSLMAALPKAASGFPTIESEAVPPRAPLPQGTAAAQQLNPSVAMLVTLAAADPAIERRRKQAVQAERGLDMLEGLHRELVAGVTAPARLQEIVEWAESFETPDDPALASILSDIELRVRVELAKLDMRA